MSRPVTRPLVHVGLIKAASTFLQSRVFADPRFGFAPPIAEARLVIADRLLLADGWDWDEAVHRRAFNALNEGVRDAVPVWSEERLLGDPVANQYGGPATAERLARAMPDARVLIVVREQRGLALSVFKEALHDGQTLDLTDVIGTGDEPVGFRPRLREDYLRYEQAVSRYRALFGEDGVLVLPVEMLRTDPDAFLAQLQAFAGVRQGVSRTMPGGRAHVGGGAASLGAVRRLNHLRRPSPRGHPVRLSDKLVRRAGRALTRTLPRGLHEAQERRLRARIDVRYAGRFAEANAALAAMTGHDLARYGYQVPA